MTTTKAAVLIGDRQMELRELPVPATPPAGGALLKIEGCGMCGSDVEQYAGDVVRMGVMRYPCIPGHEIVGRIAAMDEEARHRWGMKEGDRVAVTNVAPCGVCPPCRQTQPCIDNINYGFTSLDVGSGLWGGFSEFMEIRPRTRLKPLPESVSVEDALLFNPFAGAFDWVFKQAQVQLNDAVLITGGGQRGLACAVAAREAGARIVIVTGLRRDAYKLEIAKQLGATHTLIVEDVDVRSAVMDITQGQGVDKVIETTPLVFEPLLDAIAVARLNATIAIVGLKGNRPMPELPVDTLLRKRIRLVGARAYSDWAVEAAIDCVVSGRWNLELMHTHRLPLEQVEYAIQMLGGEVPDQSPLHVSIMPSLS